MSGTKQWNLNLFFVMLTQLRCLLINCQAQAISTFALQNIVLLYFRFYIYKHDKLITLTVFWLWTYGHTKYIFYSCCLKLSNNRFWHFLQSKFCSCCLCVFLFLHTFRLTTTSFSKKPSCLLSQELHISEF